MGDRKEFNKIQHQLEKLDIYSLVMAAMSKLREVEAKPINELNGFYPWRLLLLIKWAYEFGGVRHPLWLVDENMLVKLLNLIHDFEGAEPNPFLEEGTVLGVQKFLRTIAFQQFWTQIKLGTWAISRQKILFCDLSPDDPIRLNIERAMNGLDVGIFLELSWLVWTWLMKNVKNYVFRSDSMFQNLQYPKSEIEAFCSALSLSPIEVKIYLKNRRQLIKNPFLQLTEMSPFVRYPFLKIGDEYMVYSQQVLKETISNIFYDVMKLEGGSTLAEKFSLKLEKYVERGLSALGISYYNEEDLFRVFPGENVTDFLLPFSDFTLMIEVKAIEMRPIVRVNPENKSLQRELEDNVIKGTIQGFSLANSLLQRKDPLEIKERSQFFLMIVTYKDLFLGTGDMVWEEFLKEAIEPVLESKKIDINLIPPERIMFLSIDEFDQLVSILWQKTATMSMVLGEMLEANRSIDTRKWVFSQHLDKFRPESPQHPFLDDQFELLSNEVQKKFVSRK